MTSKPPTIGPRGGAGDSGADRGESLVKVIYDPTGHICNLPDPALYGTYTRVQCIECKKVYEQMPTFFRSKPRWVLYGGGW